ncbi:hypothetical protein K438DRAFT_2087517 [Mycena galopus ATCC 62051]|nr:hypothetical protein K438DRAFT_2087517 [Mycena galopus ATCC 62051]
MSSLPLLKIDHSRGPALVQIPVAPTSALICVAVHCPWSLAMNAPAGAFYLSNTIFFASLIFCAWSNAMFPEAISTCLWVVCHRHGCLVQTGGSLWVYMMWIITGRDQFDDVLMDRRIFCCGKSKNGRNAEAGQAWEYLEQLGFTVR